MMMACPECGEITMVVRAEPLEGGKYVRVSEVTPPPYCPMCGEPVWRELLGDEAERILHEADVLGREDLGEGDD